MSTTRAFVTSAGARVRSWRDVAVVQLKWRRDAQLREELRRARAGIRDPGLPPTRRVPGSVWAVAMVKNEADVVVEVVEHLLEQGVDHVLVADNGSTDETASLLAGLAERHPVVVTQDRETAYFQAAKMNVLADIARRAGADWVVPFDADEFWLPPHGRLAPWLRGLRADVVEARIHNVFPLSDPGAGGDDLPLREREYRVDLTPHHLDKVAFRAHRWAWLQMGNHAVFRPGTATGGARVVHLPWRSRRQLLAKVSGGAAALADNPDRSQGVHWRTLGALGQGSLDELWQAVLDGRHDDRLGWSPVGPFRLERVLLRRSWSEPAAG